jgi:hypothetical protein
MNYEIMCTPQLNLLIKFPLIKIYTTVFIKIPVVLPNGGVFKDRIKLS